MKKNNNLKQLNSFGRPKFDLWEKMNKKDKAEFDYKFVSPLNKGFMFALLILYFVCIIAAFALIDVLFVSGLSIMFIGFLIVLMAGSAMGKSKQEQEEWMIKKKYLKSIPKKKSKKDKQPTSKLVKFLIAIVVIILFVAVYLTGLMNGHMQMLLGEMLDEQHCTGDNGLFYLKDNFCTQPDPNYLINFNCRGTNSKLAMHIDTEEQMNGFDLFVGETQVFFLTGCRTQIIPLGDGN